ncbi:tetratricopeptide repeat-containing sensor histidine kinase [Chitinophaga qingshengii]|uniref:histidine kinase n=1 Tax=Chitinophaga qingshengii TaxID=1569794 RepID=A0ABR7TJ49_9BACT|nr:tetratricopeptide repeat-containing sensor histidine kinase [Chitinophaga qingshengii]MBC9930526.1 tetratricopeptide repeat-containing sensor histidine kinase [Chitinophaga qingshengii]
MQFLSVYPKQILCWLIPLLFIMLLACNRSGNNNADHPAFFQPVFQKVDLLGPGQMPVAIRILDSVYVRFPNPGPMDLTWKYRYLLDYYWTKQKDHIRGRLYADSILRVLSGKTNRPGYAVEYGKALMYLGEIYSEEGKLDNALSLYYEGRTFIAEAKDTCARGEYSARLAMVYYRQGKYKLAIPHFKDAFSAMGNCTENAFYRFCYQQAELDNIALAFDRMDQMDSALFYYDSALRYIQLRKTPFLKIRNHATFSLAAEAVVLGNKGSLLLRKGDTVTGEKLLQRSIDINIQPGTEPRDAQLNMGKLIKLQLAQKRFPEAQAGLQRMRNAIDSLPDNSSELSWNELQAQYHEATGKPGEALVFLKHYQQMKDSLARLNDPFRALDVNTQFNYLSGEMELDLLKKQNEVKNFYLNVMLIFSILVIIIGVLIWHNWNRSKKQGEKLESLNRVISRQNKHLENGLRILEQSQQDNTRILKVVAHDLRNPVGNMISMADFLLHYGNITDPQNKEALGMIQQSGQLALDLISNLLYMNLRGDIRKEEVEVDVALRYCVDLVKTKVAEKKQQIIVNLFHTSIWASREKIWRVFSNLITNAVKFSPVGGMVEVSMELTDAVVRITVRDNGIGIPDALKGNIFNLSQDVKRRGTMGEESFGFGLAISKQIVDAHGGKIWFESEEGKGTEFIVELEKYNEANHR